MATVTVTTTAGLKSALAAAGAGDTILLAPGVYSSVSIRSFVGDVTITSADPSREAVITNMTVSNSSGLTFRNLEFDRSSSSDSYAYRVESSSNITFTALDVHGSLDGNASNDQSGFLIRGSQNVTVTNSEFHELSHAVNHGRDINLNISNNEFHDIRADGIMGSGSAHVLINNNSFHDFHPAPADHPDAIQFWADAGEPTPVDIVITNNVVERGAGGSIQGIFMSSSSGPKFTDVTIAGNQLGGGMGNGIAIFGGHHITIDDNLVKSLDIKSWIRVENTDDVLMIRNEAGTFLYNGVTDLKLAENTAYNGSFLPSNSSNSTYSLVVAPISSTPSLALTVQQTLLNTSATIADFNGDGHDDILWRDQGTGVSVIWQMDGAHRTGGGVTQGFAGKDYSLIGSGDFDGDGKADLLWRDTAGSTVIWKQDGTQLIDAGLTDARAGAEWKVAAIADFNGDGASDILWRNQTQGGTAVWTMDGRKLETGGLTDTFAGREWSVVGAGDFNGDGKSDILWRNQSSGSTVVWQMDGEHTQGSNVTSAYADTAWMVTAVADFNGDGKADILWRNSNTSETVVWTMDGANHVGGGSTDVGAPRGWTVAGAGDFNGDGKADILWRNDASHETAVWSMDGQHVTSTSFTDVTASAGWAFS